MSFSGSVKKEVEIAEGSRATVCSDIDVVEQSRAEIVENFRDK